MTHVSQLDSPTLIVFPDIVEKNISLAVEMAGGANRLRPHIKTHKNPNVIALMKGAGIMQYKCATIAEAEMLAMMNVPDVLLAFPVVGPKAGRLAALIREYPNTLFSCLVDHPHSADYLEDFFQKEVMALDVYLDLNLGMNRTGIAPGDEALELYRKLANFRSLHVLGLHAYDGHIRHPEITERERLCKAAFEPVNRLRDQIVSEKLPFEQIVAGGSPSFPIHAKNPEVQCSPGTFVYWDRGYQLACPEQGFEPAARLITHVVSNPAKGLWCLDLGHKSVAAENEISKRVYFPDLPGYEPVSQSEEHLVLQSPDPSNDQLKPGDVVYGIPWHICPTVALYEKVLCIKDDNVVDEWRTVARDREL